ncbi:MAG TPA: Zn-ribbon domain-containing OB-fold protein [Pyrinomonadaceae bacterium]|jgi:uncharacterized OB-fold protein|nr:Zn-ribbon domain-containing OB-fold protein [Pyrinomonadaceae bacterium]
MSDQRPIPIPDRDSEVYWQAAHRHQLLLQRCSSCRKFRFYPRSHCPYCSSELFEWQPASGRGTVYSFTVIHRSPSSSFRDKVPYVLALIDLQEGVRMMTNVIECEPDAVEIGMPVEVAFEDLNESISLPQFRPV